MNKIILISISILFFFYLFLCANPLEQEIGQLFISLAERPLPLGGGYKAKNQGLPKKAGSDFQYTFVLIPKSVRVIGAYDESHEAQRASIRILN